MPHRNNSGNASIVQHEHTGWLFDSPKECIHIINDLKMSRSIGCESMISSQKWSAAVATIVQNAHEYVTFHHSFNSELESYARILQEVMHIHHSTPCEINTS